LISIPARPLRPAGEFDQGERKRAPMLAGRGGCTYIPDIFKYMADIRISMGTITLSIDDRTEREFRRLVEKILGKRKGALGEAATEAMDLWIRTKAQEEIARDALELAEKSYHFGGRKYTSRKDLYDRQPAAD